MLFEARYPVRLGFRGQQRGPKLYLIFPWDFSAHHFHREVLFTVPTKGPRPQHPLANAPPPPTPPPSPAWRRLAPWATGWSARSRAFAWPSRALREGTSWVFGGARGFCLGKELGFWGDKWFLVGGQGVLWERVGFFGGQVVSGWGTRGFLGKELVFGLLVFRGHAHQWLGFFQGYKGVFFGLEPFWWV